MAARPRRLSPGPATTFTAILVMAAVAGALLAQGTVRHRERAAQRSRAEADVARFEGGLRLLATSAGEAAATPGLSSFRLTATYAVEGRAARAIALAAGDGRIRSVVAFDTLAPLTEGTPLSAVPRLPAAADAAIATDRPRLVLVTLAAGPTVVAVAAVHTTTATSVAARRAATSGVVVAAVPIDELRHPLDRPALWPGAEVRITGPNGATGPSLSHPLVTRPVRVGGVVWQVAVGAGPTGRLPIGWLTLAAGLLVAAAVHVALRRQHDQRRRAERLSGTRARQLEMIAGTSAALQQSLDLADLLPAFCVNVTEELGLSGTSVLVADDDGHLVESFRFTADGRPELGPDEVVTELELRRGWRAVGRLRAWSTRPLDEVTTQSLQALADLLAVAISNAHLYQREQQAVSRLSELDALKNAFLGTVSHELRTSTTAVQGFGELLTEHWDTLPEERRRELAARIKRQAGSLRHLVDDLLDYARLEHQSLRVSPRHLSLTALVHELAASMSPLVADHEVVVVADDDVMAWADPIAVERILANLLSNAGKYSPAGTTVTVTVERRGDRARLTVADQGPGIPAEERRRVFVRFYRLSNAETVRTRGAGIGLSILHDFAEHSGADVTIDDAPGGGARVAVDFPTAPAGDGADASDALAGGRS